MNIKRSKCSLLKFIIIFSLLLPVAAVAQKNNGKSYKINGTIDSVEDGTKIYLNTLVSSNITDTAIIQNGKFRFIGKVSSPTFAVINFGEQNPNAKFFWLENIKTSFTGSGKNLDKGVIESSADNKEFEAFKRTVDSFQGNDSLTNAFYMTYIKNHPQSYLSGVALIMAMSRIKPAELKPLYQRLSSKIKNSFYGEEFEKFIASGNQTTGKDQRLPKIFTDSVTRDGFTLYFNDQEKLFTSEYKKKLIDAYFEIYPALIKEYPNSPRTVTINIDSKYGAEASASSGEITLSHAWSQENPSDKYLLKLQLQLVAKNDFDNALSSKPGMSVKDENPPVSITRNGLTLYLKDIDNYFTAPDKRNFIDSFFDEYPALIKQYNSNSAKTVSFTFDKTNGVTADYKIDDITVNKNWKPNPNEPAISITQMLTEIVSNKDVPSWATKANTKNSPANKPDTISRNGLTVYFEDADKSFTGEYKKRFVDTYFEQYPKLVKKYNIQSTKAVTFSIDKSYNGIAITINDVVIFNPAWFVTNPEDIDVITHELMHVVQGYDYNHVPTWVTEGIADYARATEGINNEKANWTMPGYNSTQNYDNSYRITARFFVWITQNYKSDFVNMLDDVCRKQNYNDATWKNITGKTLDELWTAYVANPVLK